MAKNTSNVDHARTALENAEAERERFRTSIETLTTQIGATTDLAVAMPLHTELETRRLFLVRAEGNVTKAKLDLAEAEREAERARKAGLAKTADPTVYRSKIAALVAKALQHERAWRDALAAAYFAGNEQRTIANEAGSTTIPLGYVDALFTLGRFEAHAPDLRIVVPPTRSALIPTVLACCDALPIAMDAEFRKAHSDDDLIQLALDGRLLDRHAAWIEASNRRRADGQAQAEARGLAYQVAQEELTRDPSNESKRAAFDAADLARRTPVELPPVSMPPL